MLFLPSANGPQDSIWTLFSRRNFCVSTCWWKGCVSIWLTAGATSLWSDQVHHAVGVEVAHADGRDPALPVQLLHRPPRAVHVAVGLVDQVQVQVVQAEPLQRAVERRAWCFSYPASASQSLVVTNSSSRGTPLRLMALADGLFVAVRRRRVDQAVAGLGSRRRRSVRTPSRSVIWKTPNPRIGISTPLFRVTVCIADICEFSL